MLNHDNKDYSWWVLITTHKKNPVDELSLWSLCKMLYKHCVVYTPDYTWTTLRDKTLPVDEIDKTCDLHFVYMGYGKFASITPRDTSITVAVQPTLQTLCTTPTTEIKKKQTKTPITRTRHGQHPSRTTSAHIDYYDLNQGQSKPERKSPRTQKCTSTALTLRTPSDARLAAQTHILREKDKQQTSREESDITVVATFSPDEDGTAFQRPTVISTQTTSTAPTALLATSKPTAVEDSTIIAKALIDTLQADTRTSTSISTTTTKLEKDEHLQVAATPNTTSISTTTTKPEKDEHLQATLTKNTTTPLLDPDHTAIVRPPKSEKDEQLTVSEPHGSKTNEKDTRNKDGQLLTSETSHKITVEKIVYTHALGHKCDRKHCNPIIITKHGIMRPDQPKTSHSHLSGSCDRGGQVIEPKLEQSDKNVKLERPHDTDPTTDVPEAFLC